MQFEERAGAEIFKFEREGATFCGALLEMQDVMINKKSTPAYVFAEFGDDFETPTGKQYQIAQTADMRSKITRFDVGKLVLMRLAGTKDTPGGKMNVFEIKVSKDCVI